MTFIRSIVAGIILVASTAEAQQVTVRSGDHPTFSRITIPVSPSQQWSAVKTEQGIELRLPGLARGFDTQEVFVRMKPERITSLIASDDTLLLELNCTCIATAFRSGALLVVDVADEGTTLAGPQISGSNLSEQARTDISLPKSAGLPWIGGPSPFSGPPPLTAAMTDSRITEKASSVDQRREILQEVGKSLAESVSNAASVGLLENSDIARQSFTNLQPSAVLRPITLMLPEQLEPPSSNIRFSSSLDAAVGAIESEAQSRTSGASCPEPRSFEVESWGDEREFSAQLSQARATLMDARDQLNLTAARNIAQLYVYFGFGAEALDILRLDPDFYSANSQIAAIATILERGSIPHTNPLSQYADCDSNAALWAILSFENVPADTVVASNAALRALNDLPQHLRQILAPALSNRLLKTGDSTAAAAAMRSINRLDAPLSHDGLMSQAALEVDAGRPAGSFLEKVIGANSSQSPAALIQLAEIMLSNNEALSNETATLVDAYAHELRGTQMGPKLREIQVLALAQSGQFSEALEAVAELKSTLKPETVADINKTIFDKLAQGSDDLVFLEHTFAQSSADFAMLPVSTQLSLATRMMDLGFAVQVQKMLSSFEDTPRLPERQIVIARAAIALRQPFQAQAALIGIDGPNAAILMAQAKEMTGAYGETAEIYSDNNENTQAAQAAWLSDRWQDLTSADTTDLGAAALLMSTSSVNEDPNSGPLSQANRALEESAAARNTLTELLQAPLVQVSPDS